MLGSEVDIEIAYKELMDNVEELGSTAGWKTGKTSFMIVFQNTTRLNNKSAWERKKIIPYCHRSPHYKLPSRLVFLLGLACLRLPFDPGLLHSVASSSNCYALASLIPSL